jgi:pyruvate,water dikinase
MELSIKKFSEIGIKDVGIVGGKNASLGEMYNQLSLKGVCIPNGFATTSGAFWEFLKENKIQESLKNLLKQLDRKHYSNLKTIGKQARDLILNRTFLSNFSHSKHPKGKKVCVWFLVMYNCFYMTYPLVNK